MLVDTRSPHRSTTSISASETFPMMDQQDTSYDAPRRLAVGKDSLAISSDAASLQKRVMDLARRLVLDRTLAGSTDASMVTELFPMHVDIAGFEKATTLQMPVEDREQERLAAMLRFAFETEPFEDGMDHPADQIIENALRSTENHRILDWFSSLSLDAKHPSFASSVLRCLGRQTHIGTAAWRAGLVRDALAKDDIEIRDAAVQAAESWGGQEIVDVLMSHNEPEQWLRECIPEIIDDLRE